MYTSSAVKVMRIVSVLLILSLAVPVAYARQVDTWDQQVSYQEQTQAIDYEKMDEDLSVMENVISMLLSEEDLIHFKPEKVKGAYLEGYGVVFMVPITSTTSFLRPVRPERSEKEQTVEESFKKIREILTDFASSYGAIIKQIKRNDWITMVVNPSSRGNVAFLYQEAFTLSRAAVVGEREGFRPFSFIMSVRKSDITSYREEVMTIDQFSEAVLYSPIGAQSEDYMTPKMQKDIEILSGILETILEDHLSTSLSSESIQGTYLKDYGVLFTVNAGSAISLSTGTSYNIEIKPPALPEIEVGDIKLGIDVTGAKTKADSLIALLTDSLKVLQKLAQAKYLPEVEKLILESQQMNLENTRLRLEWLTDQQVFFARAKRTEEDKEKIEKLIDVLVDVVGDYGHTIRELNANDQIAILFSSSGYRAGTSGTVNLMLTARYSDILDYSKGRITLDVFKSKVISRTFEDSE
ncbi:hypothetical protein AMJ80_05285 [bacterium SM23_31]|nr:MAG: hypothetical protein AMJ80_05285 [bacterium SM23_31]